MIFMDFTLTIVAVEHTALSITTLFHTQTSKIENKNVLDGEINART